MVFSIVSNCLDILVAIICDSEGKRKKEIDEPFENLGVSAILKDQIYIPDYSRNSRTIRVFDLNYNDQPKEHINHFISPSVVAANTVENVLYVGEYYTMSLCSILRLLCCVIYTLSLFVMFCDVIVTFLYIYKCVFCFIDSQSLLRLRYLI